jgi:hypothetical protein
MYSVSVKNGNYMRDQLTQLSMLHFNDYVGHRGSRGDTNVNIKPVEETFNAVLRRK